MAKRSPWDRNVVRVEPHRQGRLRPARVFAGAVLASFAVGVGSAALAPAEGVQPLVATTLLACAAVIGLASWRRRGAAGEVTYTDVAGALVLAGAFAAMLIEPQQMLRLVASG